jgi:transposase
MVQADRPESLMEYSKLWLSNASKIPSDREQYRRLRSDEALREVCDIEENEKPYHTSQLTRFRKRTKQKKIENFLIAQFY